MVVSCYIHPFYNLTTATDDLELFNSVNNKLLNPPGQALRHIPIKVYLPTTSTPAQSIPEGEEEATDVPQTASVRVIQSLVTPLTSARAFIVSYSFDCERCF